MKKSRLLYKILAIAGLLTCSFFVMANDIVATSRIDQGLLAQSYDKNSDSFLPSTCLDYKSKTTTHSAKGVFRDSLTQTTSHKYYNFDFEFHFELFYAGFGGMFEIEIENEKREENSQLMWSLSLDTNTGNEYLIKANILEQYKQLSKKEFTQVCGTHFVTQIRKGFNYQINVKLSGVNKATREKYSLTYGGAYMRFMLARTFLIENSRDFSDASMEISVSQKGGNLSSVISENLSSSRLVCQGGDFGKCFSLIDELMIEGKDKALNHTLKESSTSQYVMRAFSDITPTQSNANIAYEAEVLSVKKSIGNLLKNSIKRIKEAVFAITDIEFLEQRDQGYIREIMKACIDDPITCQRNVFEENRLFDFNDIVWNEEDTLIYKDFYQYCEKNTIESSKVVKTLDYLKKRLGFAKEINCLQLSKQLEDVSTLDLARTQNDTKEEGIFDISAFLLLPNLKELDISGHSIIRFDYVKMGSISIQEDKSDFIKVNPRAGSYSEVLRGKMRKIVTIDERYEPLYIKAKETSLYDSRELINDFPFIKIVGKDSKSSEVDVSYFISSSRWDNEKKKTILKSIQIPNSDNIVLIYEDAIVVEKENTLLGESEYKNELVKLNEPYLSTSSSYATSEGVLLVFENKLTWYPIKNNILDLNSITVINLKGENNLDVKIVEFGKNLFLLGGHNHDWTSGTGRILKFDTKELAVKDLGLIELPHAEFSLLKVGEDLIISGGIYLVEENRVSSEIFIFDLNNEKLSAGPSLSEPRLGHAMIQVNDDVYILGGVGARLKANKKIEKYNLLSNRINKIKAKLPVARVHAKYRVLDDVIYLYSGESIHPILTMENDKTENAYSQCKDFEQADDSSIDKSCHLITQIDYLDIKEEGLRFKTQTAKLILPKVKATFFSLQNKVYQVGGFFSDKTESMIYEISL